MRIAYLDEFPWARCDCGWIVGATHEPSACPGCEKRETPERLDRFGLRGETRKDVMGMEYRSVPYEDRFKRS